LKFLPVILITWLGYRSFAGNQEIRSSSPSAFWDHCGASLD